MKYWRYIFALILLAIAIWVIFPKIGESYREIPIVFKRAKLELLPLLLLAQALYYFGDGWLSLIVLRMGGYTLRLRDTLRIAILGVVGNQAFPILGGVAISYYFYRKLKLPHEAILFLVISWTFLIYVVYAIFFFLSLFFAPVSPLYFLPPPALVVIAGVLILIGLSLYYLFKEGGRRLSQFVERIIKLLNRLSHSLRKKDLMDPERVRRGIPRLYETFRTLENHYHELPFAFLASTFFYLGNIFTLYFSFLVFGQNLNFFHIVFGYSLSLLLSALTLVPQTPGVLLASLSLIFTALGVPAHIVVLSGTLYRLFSYWLPFVVGIFSMINMRRELRRMEEVSRAK
jgi:uncharacterized protein (TIRG00374 family)